MFLVERIFSDIFKVFFEIISNSAVKVEERVKKLIQTFSVFFKLSQWASKVAVVVLLVVLASAVFVLVLLMVVVEAEVGRAGKGASWKGFGDDEVDDSPDDP